MIYRNTISSLIPTVYNGGINSFKPMFSNSHNIEHAIGKASFQRGELLNEEIIELGKPFRDAGVVKKIIEAAISSTKIHVYCEKKSFSIKRDSFCALKQL